MKLISCLISFGALGLAGCANTLVHQPAKKDEAPKGVRWTETRTYDVYVYVGGALKYKKELTGYAATQEDPKLIYFGTHDLLPTVNGIVVDDQRPMWDVNYRAMPFSDGGLELSLDEAGMLKRVKATGKPGTAGALNAATTAAKSKDDIQAEGVADVKRKLELVKAKTDLIDQEAKYEAAKNPTGGSP